MKTDRVVEVWLHAIHLDARLVSGLLHLAATFLLEKEPPVPIE